MQTIRRTKRRGIYCKPYGSRASCANFRNSFHYEVITEIKRSRLRVLGTGIFIDTAVNFRKRKRGINSSSPLIRQTCEDRRSRESRRKCVCEDNSRQSESNPEMPFGNSKDSRLGLGLLWLRLRKQIVIATLLISCFLPSSQ